MSLRYSDVYEEIKEARRFDDALEQGDWKTDLKTADWDRVISIASDALSHKTKDLQIAAWLTEALIREEGFGGLVTGLTLTKGLMESFWESLYPLMEDGDLEYRVAPLEFMNEKLWAITKQVPVTDPSKTDGYSWLKWQESREARSAEQGRLTVEEFNKAVSATPSAFYAATRDHLASCVDVFQALDAVTDEKFGRDAPRLTELGQAIDDCFQLVEHICKDRGLASSAGPDQTTESLSNRETEGRQDELSISSSETSQVYASIPLSASGLPSALVDASPWEQRLWDESVRLLGQSGIKKAMEKLLEASLNAPSIREQNRMKLLLARLSLEAGRYDLARPILEQLNTLIEELRLEQWESPVWVANVLGSLYQCLTSPEASDDDIYRANGLFQKLCTIDITRALAYKGQ